MTPTQPSIPCICGNVDCVIPHGYCHCGCGKTTRPAGKNDKSSRRVKGIPVRFLIGHGSRIKLTVEDALPFKIEDVYCRVIPLTQEQYAIVDSTDYEWLMQWKWTAEWCKCTRSFYAVRRIHHGKSKGERVKMHRLILGLKSGNGLRGDHKNCVTLDNRRKNLRAATPTESQRNQRRSKKNKSGYKGVSWSKRYGKWRTVIKCQGKQVYLGYFEVKEDAYTAYCTAAAKYFGEFARVM